MSEKDEIKGTYYVGGLTISQLQAIIVNTIAPYHEENMKLHQEVKELRRQLDNQNSAFMTIEEVADMLKKTEASVHNYVKEGKLFKYKVGGGTLFKRAEVLAYIELTKQKSD